MVNPVQHRIGEIAGKVWHYLKVNGESTTANIEKGIELDSDMPMQKNTIYMAIGWLAREGNLVFREEGSGKRYRLMIGIRES